MPKPMPGDIDYVDRDKVFRLFTDRNFNELRNYLNPFLTKVPGMRGFVVRYLALTEMSQKQFAEGLG